MSAPDPSPWADLVPDEIVCVDCGGRAFLVQPFTAEDPPVPGGLAVYRCQDCRDRWDTVIPGAEDDE